MFYKKFKLMLISFQKRLQYICGTSLEYRPSVEQYPDMISARSAVDLFPKTKGFLKNDLSLCTGCGDCLEVCSVNALTMQSDLGKDGMVEVREFGIDLGRCYFCSACVDVCPVSSISHTKEYEMAADSLVQMQLVFSREAPSKESFISKVRRENKKIRTYEVRR